MEALLLDTRAFSMARNPRCNKLSILALFFAAVASAPLSPAMARDADDVFGPPQIAAQLDAAMWLIRPQPRPDILPPVAQASRSAIVAPTAIIAPQTIDRSRIRQTWSIGVFR
jgi:hypothetical protein